MGEIFFRAGTNLAYMSGNIVNIMMEYYKRQFPKNFFKYTHINTQMSMNEIQKNVNKDLDIKKSKPLLLVDPSIDFSYESPYEKSFMAEKLYNNFSVMDRNKLNNLFQDYTNNIYIDYMINEYKMTIRFDIILESLIQSYNTANFVKNTFISERPYYINRKVESNIPRHILERISKTTGLEFNSLDFVKYLNVNSKYPITYKLKKSSGNSEYFMYMEENFRVTFNKINVSDGNSEGFDKTGFMVSQEMEIIFKNPSIFYYTQKEIDSFINIVTTLPDEHDIMIPLFTSQIKEFPMYDSNNRKLDVNVLFKIDKVTDVDVTNIESMIPDYIKQVLEYNRDGKIPNDFINVAVLKNDDVMVYGTSYEFDTETLDVKTYDIDVMATYRILLYYDFEYINNVLSKLKLEQDRNTIY